MPIGDSFSATHPIARSGTAVFMEVLDAKGSDAGRGFEYYASWVPQSM